MRRTLRMPRQRSACEPCERHVRLDCRKIRGLGLPNSWRWSTKDAVFAGPGCWLDGLGYRLARRRGSRYVAGAGSGVGCAQLVDTHSGGLFRPCIQCQGAGGRLGLNEPGDHQATLRSEKFETAPFHFGFGRIFFASGISEPRTCASHRATKPQVSLRLDPIGRRPLTPPDVVMLPACALRLPVSLLQLWWGWLAVPFILAHRSRRQGLRALWALAAFWPSLNL